MAGVYWFRRPPYLRWSIAALIVAAAAFAELRGSPTVRHPFVTAAVPQGTDITEDAVELREVPAGLLPPVEAAGARAARPLSPGEPLLPSDVAATPAAPAGWWLVPMRLPDAVGAGREVRVVLTDPPADVPGVVVAAGSEDGLGTRLPGLVAVPGPGAVDVARAAAADQVMVLVAP